jgi:hypothetical protein
MGGSETGWEKGDYLQYEDFDVSSWRSFCLTKETGEHNMIYSVPMRQDPSA